MFDLALKGKFRLPKGLSVLVMLWFIIEHI